MAERDGSTFPYERAITMGLGALLVAALASGAYKFLDLSVAMERKADATAVTIAITTVNTAIGNIDRDVVGLKLGQAFAKQEIDRRLDALERTRRMP